MRQQTVFEAGENDDIEFEAFGGMQGHQADGVGSFLVVVLFEQGDGIEEGFEFLAPLGGFRHRSGKLLEILAACGLLLVVAVVHGEQTGGLEQPTHEVTGIELGPFLARVIENPKEAFEGDPRPGAELLREVSRRLDHGRAITIGAAAQDIDGGRADAAGRDVDHPLEGDGVVGSDDQTEIGEGVLDLGALPETKAPDDPVGHVAAGEFLLEAPGLSVGADEHRHLGQRVLPLEFGETIGDPSSFGALVRADVESHVIAALPVGEEGLAPPAQIGGDEGAGGSQDR